MRFLILHISDLHIESKNDLVLTRADNIARTVQDLDHCLDRCVVAISGDVAYAGNQTQLTEGWAFFSDLRDKLKECLVGSGNEVPVSFVAVPGNHDCYFDHDDELRIAARQRILDERTGADDSSLVSACTKPLQPFLQSFVDELMESRLIPEDTEYPGDLYYEYVIYEDEKKYIRFRCCNTAWLSKLHEDQGELYFPAEAIREAGPSGDEVLAVTVFHHPYNWLEANSARRFRERVESVSDIVLTGHEHDGSRSERSGESGEINQYIEAGSLQESHDPTHSSFNALVVDTEVCRQKFRRYWWSDDQYQTDYESDGWEPLQISRYRKHADFDLSEHMQDFLEDLGTTIEHPRVGRLKLNDIFVYPDIQRVESDTDRLPGFTSSSNLGDEVQRQKQILISGDDTSGRTCLAKRLFLELYRNGFVPLYLRGRSDQLPDSNDALIDYLEEVFCCQYGEDQLEKYRQMDRDERVVILDDYHHLPQGLKGRSSLLEFLCQHSGHVVLTTDEILAEVEELTQAGSGSEENLASFIHYRIKPFGNVCRDKLIKKWLTLGRTVSPDRSKEIVKQQEELRHLLDTIFGNDFVPAYPSYILPVLYAREASMQVDQNAGTHGYFYGILIRSRLAEGRSQTEYDVLTGYLSHLAYRFFSRDTNEITEEEFYEIHNRFQERFDIARHGGDMLGDLLDMQILEDMAGVYRFKRRYFYYYFVADYISDRLREDEIQDDVSALCRNLHIEECSNILLFLAHKSKDAFIIQELLEAASELLPDCEPAALDDDVGFFDDLREEIREIIYREQDPETSRRKLLERRDELEHAVEAQDTESDFPDTRNGEDLESVTDPVREATVALRTLNILGQVLKNFPGTLEKEPKLEVATACYELGLRTLSFILGIIRDNREDFVYEIAETISSDNPEEDVIEIRNKVRDLVASICQAVSFGIIKRTANAVGSPELSKTYRRVLQSQETPAIHLINTSLALNYTKKSPAGNIIELADELEDNPLPFSMLRYMILRHFMLYPVDRTDKQRLCERLDISYKRIQVQSADPRQKMIGD